MRRRGVPVDDRGPVDDRRGRSGLGDAAGKRDSHIRTAESAAGGNGVNLHIQVVRLHADRSGRLSALPATTRWDGASGVKSDSPEVDIWTSPGTASAWESSAPFAGDLKSYVAKTMADTAKYHGDTCTAPPETQEQVTVGGESGILIGYNCGILINLAVTVHDGVGYTFGFRDPAVQAAAEPADHALLVGLLESLQFPATQ